MGVITAPGAQPAVQLPAPVTPPNVLDERILFNGHLYQRFDYGLPWSEAKDFAENMGGYLATVTTSDEQKFIVSMVRNSPQNYYWLGGINNGAWQ